eukprot:5493103-Alexandrium_andersonii.AAC.1
MGNEPDRINAEHRKIKRGLEEAGLVVHPTKTHEATSEWESLGVHVDGIAGFASIKAGRRW